MADPRQTSIHLQSEDGIYRIAPDSRVGGVYRPFAVGPDEGYTSTLETLYQYFINDVPDPDQALALDPEFLIKLNNHPDVAAAFRKRSFTVSQMPWRLEPSEYADDQVLAKKIATCCQFDFSRVQNFESVFLEMEDAVLSGGAGHEWRWHREADGTERPIAFKPVHKTRFLFDRMGNLALKTRDLPVWGAYLGTNPSNPDWSRKLPAGKFTYHVHRRAPGAWYRPEDEGYIYWGIGEDVPLYYVVTFDFFVWRFELKWLEKYGLPPTDLYHMDNRSPAEVRAIAASIRGETVRTIPMGAPLAHLSGDARKQNFYAIETPEVPSPSYSAFGEYYRTRTKSAVNNILLGSAEEQDKDSSGGKGGYSDHVSRRDSGPMIFYGWDARNIGNTLTSQLVWPMVERGPFRGVPMTYCPRLVLEPKEEKDQEKQVKVLGETAKFVQVSKKYFYEAAGIERPTEQEIKDDEVVGGEQQDPLDAMMAGGGAGAGAGGRFGKSGDIQGGGAPASPIGQGNGNGKSAVANK